MRKFMLAAFVLITLPPTVFAQHQHHAAPSKSETPSDQAYMDAHHKMMKDMAVEPTGDADYDFVAMMIPHHVGAVDMAKIQLEYGKDPELRKLAQEVIEAQEKEIAFMKRWMEKNSR